MKITIEIEDSKGRAFLEFIRLISFVKIVDEDKLAEHGEWPDIE